MDLFLLLVLPWIATEVCWSLFKSRSSSTRLNVYVLFTVAVVTLGSWMIGLARERALEFREGKVPENRASHVTYGTAAAVAGGTLAFLCVSWGTRALAKSSSLWPLALVLYLLALPLFFLSVVFLFGASNW
jgi:hypothetical protein